MIETTAVHPSSLKLGFRSRILPVVVIEDANAAVDVALALLEGGIDAVEVTLRTGAALHAIERIARSVAPMTVGAGTVLTPNQLRQAQDAGARFALSPGCTRALLDAACSATVPFIPGVATPSEAMMAAEAGFDVLKCFPAEPLGGPAALRAWSAALPHLRWCPTGGITAQKLGDYLQLPQVALVGGSWMATPALIADKAWTTITELAHQAAQIDTALRA
jgi:2-dehydro-3-deoxyphosphogluconate aldolase/(4S)-4-hydroxy-2-oxoglutarate aldolase